MIHPTHNIELKPCPMCGQSEAKILGYNGTSIRWVECPKCGLQTCQHAGEENAANAWNQRVGEDQNG